MNSLTSSNLGYPRIGEKREWKKTLEAFWKGKITEASFEKVMKSYRLQYLNNQIERNLDYIPVGDFSLYDHVLDTAVMFGLVPDRFQYQGGKVPLSTYFAMARGTDNAHACEMTKWFDTNYHYIVPELKGLTPKLVENKPLQAFLEAKTELNVIGKPVILGPFTFLKLSKGFDQSEFADRLNQLASVYIQLLQELKEAGATFVQIDEPSLVTDISEEEMSLFTSVYHFITDQVPDLDIIVQTYFEAVTHYDAVVNLPVKGIGLDFVAGFETNFAAITKHGFPKDKILAAGIIDGRNIWKSNLEEKLTFIKELSTFVDVERLLIQPSSSLLHVPVSLTHETTLDRTLKNALAFSHEKLEEINMLKKAITVPSAEHLRAIQAHTQSFTELTNSNWRKKVERNPLATERAATFNERHKLQKKKWKLPLLPTTTIGSFPQTSEIRQARARWRRNELSNEAYDALIKAEIKKWIEIQEKIGLDVFVHGEFERNDMVEFFGEKLAGFAFSKNGWVQSYGSRCVKPPIIFGNVLFVEPMTVNETLYAQSLTEKPVKGMLTGPVTILNWSFVRDDIPKKEVAFQIAEALLKEVKLLESAGITMIQVDEPALREGLPLKKTQHNEYLTWAVEAFRMSTSQIDHSTQIHTHMCYCDFNDIIDSIRALDADVISIETSRSHAELISAFEHRQYDKGIGLGVYDIHSPRIPKEEEMVTIIQRALTVLPPSLFWVNPDCGLKTRTEQETVAALSNMVQSAKKARTMVAITNS
ncbi:5-methyltetrahydropteroyltriglutamate--homocysteine S-methyltransferase [Halalkalibacter krulwichiae]|uniref:5-methyltetrahydropteroyltriglutamate--homocysteine methyltransferase n=1 Tax=Halalkalibacter krulwichiae TaxID=199441 RepID=A0A1X9MA00_9BACI|nr:5-methyltetrahydropteroyltriglutamate--homocysteine S-methyltransferase [Halalkalibacter krulwichiae]ARK30245.1 5-methyltetrahydropteroyltriglutamate--homocysteine methyltransferase [Halalkalibacter krulwichiae]